MRPSARIAAIFEREIARLDNISQDHTLDAADIDKFVKLVTGYRKYTPTDPDAPDEFEGVSPATLLSQLNATNAAPEDGATSDKDGSLEAE